MKSANAPLKDSICYFKQHKKKTAVLLLLQLLFFAFLVPICLTYITQIVPSSQNILEYIESVNPDPQQANLDIINHDLPLGDDPLLITRNYADIKRSLWMMILSIVAAYLVTAGVMWFIIQQKKATSTKKQLIQYARRAIPIIALMFGTVLLFLFCLANILFSSFLVKDPRTFVPVAIIAVMLFYLLFAAIPLIKRYALKQLPKKVIKTVKENFFRITAAFLLISGVGSLTIIALFIAADQNLFILLVSILLVPIIFTWGKIYWYLTMKNLSGF